MLALMAIFFATKVYFLHDLDRFLPKDRNDHQFLTNYQQQLEADDSYYLIGLHSKKGVFQKEFLLQLDSLTKACTNLPHIISASSISNISNPVKTPFGLITIPAVHINDEEKYSIDSTKLLADERLVDRYISRDAKTVLVTLKTENSLRQSQAEELDKATKALLGSFQFEEWHVTGKANIQTEFVELIQSELVFYIILCNLFLTLVLIFIFRRFWAVVIALVSVLLGAIFFTGLLGAFGIPLDLMSMLFPPLMLIVGMSDVVHFLTKYVDELKNGVEKNEAMLLTVKEIGWATFLTSATTAVGFAALYFSKIEPIRTFGLTAALGVFIAYLTVLFFTTSVLLLLRPDQIMFQKNSSTFYTKLLHNNYLFVQNNVRSISLGTIILLIFCFVGISQISTNAYVLSDVPSNSKLMDDVRFFDKELSGIRSYELAILPQQEHKVTDYAVLKELDKLENYLKTNSPVKSILNPTTIFKSLNKAHHSNRQSAYHLPNEKKIKTYKRLLKNASSKQLRVLVSEDESIGRFSGSMIDIGSDSMRMMNDQILTWVDQNIDPSVVQFRPTGTALVIDKNNDYLITSLGQSLAFALLVVSILMALLFKDIRLVLISLIPNIFPLFFAAAIIGFVGIELKASTSIIFAIAFGIAVDDTIHFLSKFKIERDKGHSIRRSIYQAYIETGKAILLTTIILFLGFSLLIFSNFNGVYYVGFLISLALLAALAACLILMPIFILVLLGGRKEAALFVEPLPIQKLREEKSKP